jgi:hypothetical protein
MTAREEMDLLLRVTSQVAQKMLESGGLMHFGTMLGPKRDVQMLMPKSMKEKVAWQELADYWKDKIGTASTKMAWRAVACSTFVKLLSGDDSFKASGLLVHVEHFEVQTGAEDIAYEYERSDHGNITLREVTRASAGRWISGNAQPSPIQQ